MDSNLNGPSLSVIMPVYNCGLYIRFAVESILNQTFRDFELLILNDGSTDNTAEVLRSFSDKRIKLINYSKNTGILYARNELVKLASGKFIACMDGDDIADSTRLEKQLKVFQEKPEVSVVVARIRQIDKYGNEAGVWEDDFRFITSSQIEGRMPVSNCIAHPTAMIRADVLKKYRYESGIKSGEDWDLWLRLLADGHLIYKITEILLSYRIHDHSTTVLFNRGNLYLNLIRFKWNFLKKCSRRGKLSNFHLSVLKSLLSNLISYPLQRWVIPFYLVVRKVVRANPLMLVWQLLIFKFKLKALKGKKIFFFFPYYHTGGAEKVHASIVEAVQDGGPVVFFTRFSAGDGFLERFKSSSTCINIPGLCSYPVFDKLTMQMLSKFFNSNGGATLFSCNSEFFYKLIPLLEPKVQCIDLIHAFVHADEQGPEKWSLPVTRQLDKRVFISQSAIEQLRSWYRKNGFEEQLMERVIFIRNYADVIAKPPLGLRHPALRIIYIGRGTPEKRVALVGEIATAVRKIVPEITFTLVGKLEHVVSEANRGDCIFTGEIKNTEQMNQLMSESDILILTSDREGMPMVIMEAMGSGVVAVSTNVGDVKSYLRNSENGFLVDDQTNEKIIAAFSKIILGLNDDRDKLVRMKEQAWKDAGELFSKKIFVDHYRELLINSN